MAPAADAAILRRMTPVEPETLDPHKAQGVYEYWMALDQLEGLVTVSADGKPVPGAATGWDVASDGLTYTFHLRDGALWSNGDPVTAEDFVYSFRRAFDPKTASPYASVLNPIAQADDVLAGTKPTSALGVAAPDSKTVVITLAHPTAYFPGLMTLHVAMPVHRATVEKWGIEWTRPGHMVGNGPFIMDSWTPQSEIVLKKNPRYHDAANVALDEVHYVVLNDLRTASRKFRTGELDIQTGIAPEDLPEAKASFKQALRGAPFFSNQTTVFNMTRPPFGDNPKLRQAVALAIDWATIEDKVIRLDKLPATGFIPPGIEGYTQQKLFYADMPMAERIAKARELYKEAGYGPDKPLKFDLLYPTDTSIGQRTYTAFAAMLKQNLGIEVTLVNREWQVYLAACRQHNFDMAYSGWVADYRDPYTFFSQFVSDAEGLNYPAYHSKAYDALMAKAEATVDPKARFAVLAEGERQILADLPFVPEIFDFRYNLVQPQVTGWIGNILDIHPSRYLSVHTVTQ